MQAQFPNIASATEQGEIQLILNVEKNPKSGHFQSHLPSYLHEALKRHAERRNRHLCG